jgi:hypothetical protein
MSKWNAFSRRAALGAFGAAALRGLSAGAAAVPSLAAASRPEATGSDANAGTWKMLVLNSSSQVAVPAPAPVNDAAYLAEVAAVKAAQSKITAGQRQSMDYWSRGGVIRWNEILLELVSKLNLPPAPLPDGSYPVPDSSNPFADPNFPFANPPYAARAYSYVAVAQYEALKAAWYYKYLYNRQAPTRVDSGVQALRPSLDLPAYPSEEAVLSGVATTMLQLLFPTEVEYFTLKAAQQREAALLSGRATASDISAGLALGQAVANLVIARARTDGMGASVGTPAVWQSFVDQTTARGEIPWRSLEDPPRPPMLPLFGRVTPWMMTAADLLAERPAAPPSTSSAQMAKEVAEVYETVSRLTRRQMAIAYNWSDGVGTPTPPGRWNLIATPHIADAGYSEVRIARIFAMLNMAMHDAAVACWDTKFAYYNPRPVQLDPRIKTVIGLPNFPSYTSGHSTFSAAAAEVLSYFFPNAKASFEADRDEAAISRLYGGIHYRADIEVGKYCGQRVGSYTVRFAREDGADA